MNHCRPLVAILLTTLVGCSRSSDGDPLQGAARVPVTGTIRVDGQPLSGAVVVFLPVDEAGKVAQADTDEEGKYALRFGGIPGGTTPGKYRVGVSYLVARSGEPIGVSGRGAIPPNPEVAYAKELLTPKYSDLGRTELSAVVTPPGGSFDFDLKGPLLPAPSKPNSESAPDQPATSDASTPPTSSPATTPAEPPKPSDG